MNESRKTDGARIRPLPPSFADLNSFLGGNLQTWRYFSVSRQVTENDISAPLRIVETVPGCFKLLPKRGVKLTRHSRPRTAK